MRLGWSLCTVVANLYGYYGPSHGQGRCGDIPDNCSAHWITSSSSFSHVPGAEGAEDAEGAEVAPEYQAGVLAMARARMEASNADAEQGLAEAAAQTKRQRAAHAGLEEELAEVREDARDQYFFLQQQLDADFERIAALERRAVVDGVDRLSSSARREGRAA